jgi:hypothetical protein
MIHRRSSVLILLLCSFQVYQAAGQATNYWTENYGEYSILLNGAVIGSVQDLGAVYYNPGKLREDIESAFTLNTKAYQYTKIKVKEGAGEGLDLNKSDFNTIPSLAAGQFGFKKIPRHKFAYSFLSRTNTDPDFFIRQTDYIADILPSVPGDELFTGELELERIVRDEWLGLTWAFKVNPVFSFGITNYLSIYKNKTTLDLGMRALLDDGSVVLLGNLRNYEIKTLSLLWKVGMALTFDNVTLGLAMTTPKINVGGDGSFEYEDFLTGLAATDPARDDRFISSYQENLETASRYPFTLGIGIGGRIKKNTIHISAEWFSKVRAHKQIDIDPFTGQSTGEEIIFEIKDKRNHVINAGIGADIFIADKVQMLFSFATDFSSRASALDIIDGITDEDGARFASDIYHFGFGFSFKARWAEVSVGTVYSHSNFEMKRPVNFPDEDNEPVFDNEELVDIRQSGVRFILGVSLPFMKDVVKD